MLGIIAVTYHFLEHIDKAPSLATDPGGHGAG